MKVISTPANPNSHDCLRLPRLWGRRKPEGDGGAEVLKIDTENRIPSQPSGVLCLRLGRKMVLSEQVSKQPCGVPEKRPKLPRAPVPEAARARVVTLEAALAALADFSGPEVDALKTRFGTWVSCRVPPTSGCPIDAMPTVHRPDCQMHRQIWTGLEKWSQSVCRRLGIGCSACNKRPQRVCQCHPVAGTVGKVRGECCRCGKGWRHPGKSIEEDGSDQKTSQ